MNSLLLAAVLCGIAGALSGNRTAWPLLASVALCKGLDAAGVAFDLSFWMMIDLMVALAIVRPGMTRLDIVVVALFIPAWAAYLLPDPWRYYGALGAVCAQFVLTLPFVRVAHATARYWQRIKASAQDFEQFVWGLHAHLR